MVMLLLCSRARFGLCYRSLNASNIQSIVEKGCPNVFRKPVNSAKRLRAHLKLDEEDVSIYCDMHDKRVIGGHTYIVGFMFWLEF